MVCCFSKRQAKCNKKSEQQQNKTKEGRGVFFFFFSLLGQYGKRTTVYSLVFRIYVLFVEQHFLALNSHVFSALFLTHQHQQQHQQQQHQKQLK